MEILQDEQHHAGRREALDEAHERLQHPAAELVGRDQAGRRSVDAHVVQSLPTAGIKPPRSCARTPDDRTQPHIGEAREGGLETLDQWLVGFADR